MIAPALDSYVKLIAFDVDEKPYVFCAARDPNRCLTSSAWSAYCKGIFKKWSGVACPCGSHTHTRFPLSYYLSLTRRVCACRSPKMLRASFVTWIRNNEASRW